MTKFDVIIVGGGAVGFFTAINLAEKHRNCKIAILEKGKNVLQKVKISGGGRCNVTHNCFEPSELVKNYPRGNHFLKKPFEDFGPKETISWFKNHGVPLKVEKDGRMFPQSNTSETIVNCFTSLIKKYKISLLTSTNIYDIQKKENAWVLNQTYECKSLVVATGSSKAVWDQLESLGLKIASPVPSLFTFNIKDKALNDLKGISLENVEASYGSIKTKGPVLFTHWGLSGPAILKLSAFAAIEFAKKDYNFSVRVNFLPNVSPKEILNEQNGKARLYKSNIFKVPTRFWHYILQVANIREFQNWDETGKKQVATITKLLTDHTFTINGKSTFKEEFVTAGGVELDQINEQDFSVKGMPNLFLGGEVLNIDAITGGFNFQAAWTAAHHIANSETIV